jgi:hypothetical protein
LTATSTTAATTSHHGTRPGEEGDAGGGEAVVLITGPFYHDRTDAGARPSTGEVHDRRPPVRGQGRGPGAGVPPPGTAGRRRVTEEDPRHFSGCFRYTRTV